MTAPGPGQVLFAFVRHWSRRQAASDDVAEQGRLVLVTEAVHSLTKRGLSASVNEVADEVGIDQSGASRLVAHAVDEGFLIIRPWARDARRRHATVTQSGHSMLARAHQWQEEVFDQLTDGWSQRQRTDLQEAMAKLMDSTYSMHA